jgi:predicted transcriptional regulator of viral defense system
MTLKLPSARSVPPGLSWVLEELELQQPQIVTKDLLDNIRSKHGLQASSEAIAYRLQRHGWLLSLKTRGAWEFAPASRAGPINSGDPFVELRATLLRRPKLKVAVAYESAAWLHKLMGRIPQRQVLTIPTGITPPPAFVAFRITRHWGKLAPEDIRKLPVWRLETLLVSIAAFPAAFRAWPTIKEWLPDAAGKIDENLVLEELSGSKAAAWARTGYMFEVAGRRDLAYILHKELSTKLRAHGPFYLGPRRARGRYSKHWDLLDSVLRPQDTSSEPYPLRDQNTVAR